MTESSKTTFAGTEFSDLIKRADRLVAGVPHRADLAATIADLAAAITTELGERLGVVGGRVYARDDEGDSYRLVRTFGAAHPIENPPLVSGDYAPVAVVRQEGTVYMEPDDPRLDRELENALGAGRFAAIEVGEGEYLLAFDLDAARERDAALVSLSILRHSIDQKIRRERMDDALREARKIQASILPRRVPGYGSFDLAGRNEPLETVGGDFFDFIPLSPKILGLAIADASGHGLPAALQVRDIYMGLRMGLGRDYKIVRTVERLSKIIHESILTSRFVSMFYGELELNGNFLYVNAGHPPPFHLGADGEVAFLESGGVVLGPLPDASYERGFVAVEPGDLLVLYTDGIVEARLRGGGDEYGVDRLVEVVRRFRQLSAQEVVDAVFT
ncbi:MAG TPA: PP2C family protein-serine/threonine phosphatase, partial [Thermoanaerobaculia bacterium]|nr:PP2C family protein-serine/threonine phosphatase [Thermoanaerobaculia bacterium]